MSFLRHEEIYRSDALPQTWGPGAAFRWSAPGPSPRTRRARALLIVRDEFPVGYSLASCSPAELTSASPTALSMRCGLSAANRTSANGNLSLISVPQQRGSVQTERYPRPTPKPGDRRNVTLDPLQPEVSPQTPPPLFRRASRRVGARRLPASDSSFRIRGSSWGANLPLTNVHFLSPQSYPDDHP
jgi:hypothetical protein